MSSCDVCGQDTSWAEGTGYSADEFREAVKRGYVPVDRLEGFFANLSMMHGLSRSQALEQWKSGLVAHSTTDWLLCPACATGACRYLPRKSGKGRSGAPTHEPVTPAMVRPVSTPAPAAPPPTTPAKPETVTFACPKCGNRMRTLAEHAGRNAKCSKCQHRFPIPRKKATASAPPAGEMRVVAYHDRGTAPAAKPELAAAVSAAPPAAVDDPATVIDRLRLELKAAPLTQRNETRKKLAAALAARAHSLESEASRVVAASLEAVKGRLQAKQMMQSLGSIMRGLDLNAFMASLPGQAAALNRQCAGCDKPFSTGQTVKTCALPGGQTARLCGACATKHLTPPEVIKLLRAARADLTEAFRLQPADEAVATRLRDLCNRLGERMPSRNPFADAALGVAIIAGILAFIAGVGFFIYLKLPKNDVSGVALAPDGNRVVAANADGVVRMWLADNSTMCRQVGENPMGVNALALSSDGSKVLTGGDDKEVWLRYLYEKRSAKRFFGHTGAVTAVAFALDGKHVLSGSKDRTVRWWDVEANREEWRSEEHGGAILSVAVSPDNRHALVGAEQSVMCLWNMDTNRKGLQFEGHTGAVTSVAISPKGRLALSGSRDKSVRLWSMETGAEVGRLGSYREPIAAVAFSHDGDRVAVAAGNDIHVFDTESRAQVKHLQGHQAAIRCIAFSADGRRLVSGGSDRTTRLWDLEAGQELRQFVAAPKQDVLPGTLFTAPAVPEPPPAPPAPQ